MSSRLFRRGTPGLVLLLLAGACASSSGAAPPPCPDPEAVPERPAPRAALAPLEGDAPTTERRRGIKLLGFGPDDLVALDVEDDLMGPSYQVYDPATARVLKSYPYTSFTAAQVWKKVARVHKISALDGASQRRRQDGLALLGADADGWVVFYVMQGERAVPYLRVPRLVDEEGAAADVRVPRLAWSPDGRWAVAIHTQTLHAPRPWESDFLTVFAVDAARLPFD